MQNPIVTKNSWSDEFDVRYKSNENYVFDEVTFLDLKSFISSLLAKQQEEFVKIVKNSRTVDEHFGLGIKEETARNQVIADIKSKLIR